MASILDTHKYSQEALLELGRHLRDESFQRSYIKDKDDYIRYVGGFIYELLNENEELCGFIKNMDKIDGIQAENSKSRLEKITRTWLVNAYFQRLKNGYAISKNAFVRFVQKILKTYSETNEKQLIFAAKKLFEQYNDVNKKKLQRTPKNQRIVELQERYPEFDVASAYTYATISGTFKIKNDDLQEFERILTLLCKKTD